MSIEVAVLTGNGRYAETPEGITLIVNAGGQDIINEPLTPRYGSTRRGQGALFEAGVTVAAGDLINATDAYYRIGILGPDQWSPHDAVIWGGADGEFIPLAMALDITEKLSTDAAEGPATIPIPKVAIADDDAVVRRLYCAFSTANNDPAGTAAPVALDISSGESLLDQLHIPETPQNDLGRATESIYIFGLSTPFSRHQLENGEIRLSISGEDQWSLDDVKILGITTESGPPEAVVPLVSMHPAVTMSTDETEGPRTLLLDLVQHNI